MHFTADQAWWSGPWSRERPLCWDGMYVRIPSYHTWPYGIIGREVGPAAWVQRNGEERANIPGACVAFETPLFRRTSCGQHTDIPTPAYDITAGLYDMITQWCSSLMRSIPYHTIPYHSNDLRSRRWWSSSQPRRSSKSEVSQARMQTSSLTCHDTIP